MICEKLLGRAKLMGIPLSEPRAQQIEEYHRLLLQKNAVLNLTRVPEDEDEAIDRNYLDSLGAVAVFPELWAKAKSVIDVGTGAGLPGLPLAILCPDIQFTLLDALGKRIDFISEVVQTLGLKNVHPLHLRAEDAARKPELRESFDIATARALAALNLLSEYLLPFVRPGGVMLCYKGPGLDEEILNAAHAFEALGGRYEAQKKVLLPGRDWDHRLCLICKTTSTPDKYPRRAGKPEKKPL